MSLANARAALDRLEQIYDARSAWIKNAVDIRTHFTSLHGVSGDVTFVETATALFDAQVAHVVRQERERLIRSLDAAFPEIKE